MAKARLVDEVQLRNFLMIGKCASITEAADRLGIAQPSLSQQLLRLEDQLATKLFRRTSRGVAPTEAGRIFQEHAHSILGAMARARDEVLSSTHTPHGDVAFGIPSSTSQLLGVPLLVEVRNRFPSINLRIREAMSGNIRRWLEEGRVDLAILYDAGGARHLSTKPIANETLFLIGPRGEFGAADDRGIALNPVESEILGRSNLILPAVGHGLRRLIDRETIAGAVDVKIAIEIDSLPHIKTLIAQGMGYSLLSQASVGEELARGELSAVRIDGLDLSRGVSLVRNPSHTVTRASVEIEDLAVSLLHEMIADGRWIAEVPSDEAV